MRNEITYEWTVEEIDEHGDITDCHFYDSFPGMPEAGMDIGLVRHVGNKLDGEIERHYAYIENGELGEFFMEHVYCERTGKMKSYAIAKVPQRFFAEMKRMRKAA